MILVDKSSDVTSVMCIENTQQLWSVAEKKNSWSAQVGASRRRSAQVGAGRRKSAQVGAGRRKSAQVGAGRGKSAIFSASLIFIDLSWFGIYPSLIYVFTLVQVFGA